jgi:hypothetical protein
MKLPFANYKLSSAKKKKKFSKQTESDSNMMKKFVISRMQLNNKGERPWLMRESSQKCKRSSIKNSNLPTSSMDKSKNTPKRKKMIWKL